MKARGITLVELMVGLAIGLFAVSAATSMYVDYLGATRRTLLQTRISQDLQSASGLIARHLRRAGHWADADSVASARRNPNATITTARDRIEFTYTHEREGDEPTTQGLGFRVRTGVLQMRIGDTAGTPAWQALTDPAVLVVDAFDITPHERAIELAPWCECQALGRCESAALSADPNRPQLWSRHYTLHLHARSTRDATLERSLDQTVYVRNDTLQGSCP